MLAIPVMKSEGSFSLLTLRRTLLGDPTIDEMELSQEIQRLELLRREVINVTDPSEETQERLLKYCTELKSLIPRLHGLSDSEIDMKVTWKDAFGSTGPNGQLRQATSQHPTFELAVSVWNLASHWSRLAASRCRNTDDGIRLANKYFQLAAGCLDELQEQIMPQVRNHEGIKSNGISSLPCLSRDGLLMSSNLMLAQAQLCFYEKALCDRKKGVMKSSIVARLALQTSHFYDSVSRLCKAGPLSSVLDLSWQIVTGFQALSMNGAAEYWAGQSAREHAVTTGSGYGEEVARYNRAEKLIQNALAIAERSKSSAVLIPATQDLLSTVQSKKTAAMEELRTIYLEPVTEDSALTAISPVAMVKPLPIDWTAHHAELLQFIMPVELRNATRHFKEEAARIVADASTTSEHATAEARLTLQSLGLPDSLTLGGSNNAIPESVWNRVQNIQNGNANLTNIRNQLDDLLSMSTRAQQSMSSIDSVIQREERTDQDFRKRNPTYTWNSSADLLLDTRNGLLRMRSAFASAQANDTVLRREVMEDSAGFGILRTISNGTRDDVAALYALPQEMSTVDDRISTIVPQIRENYDALESLLNTRQSQLEEIRGVSNANLSKELQAVMAGEAAIADIHIERLNAARALLASIKEGVKEQTGLISTLVSQCDTFARAKSNHPQALHTEQVTQRIDEAINKLQTLASQVASGISFYISLQTKLTQLQQNVDDISYMQHVQRQEFEAGGMDQITTGMAGSNLGSSQYGSSLPISPISGPPIPGVPPSTAAPYTSASSTAVPPSLTSAEMENRVNWMITMGFERSAAMKALVASQWDVNIAINNLVEGQNTPNPPQTESPTSKGKSGGLLGMFGKKN